MVVDVIIDRDRIPVPQFEFSLASGDRWPQEIEFGGPYAGAVVDLALCRERGQRLLGAAPGDLIGPIDSTWILDELRQTVRWHRERLHDSFHDPWGYMECDLAVEVEDGIVMIHGFYAEEESSRRAGNSL